MADMTNWKQEQIQKTEARVVELEKLIAEGTAALETHRASVAEATAELKDVRRSLAMLRGEKLRKTVAGDAQAEATSDEPPAEPKRRGRKPKGGEEAA